MTGPANALVLRSLTDDSRTIFEPAPIGGVEVRVYSRSLTIL